MKESVTIEGKALLTINSLNNITFEEGFSLYIDLIKSATEIATKMNFNQQCASIENLMPRRAEYVPGPTTKTHNVKFFSGGTTTHNIPTTKVRNEIIFNNVQMSREQNMCSVWNKFEITMKEYDEFSSFRNIEALYNINEDEEMENLDSDIDELLGSLTQLSISTSASRFVRKTTYGMPTPGRNVAVSREEKYRRRYDPNNPSTNSTTVQRNQCDLMVRQAVVAPTMSTPVVSAPRKVGYRPFYDQRNYFRRYGDVTSFNL